MSKIFIILILLCNISCGLQINSNDSFVVEAIKTSNTPSLCIYQIQSYNISEFDVIDSIGKFNIGDTLSLSKHLNK